MMDPDTETCQYPSFVSRKVFEWRSLIDPCANSILVTEEKTGRGDGFFAAIDAALAAPDKLLK